MTSREMPLEALRAFRPAIVPPNVAVRPMPAVSFADLVRMLAEGVADAQTALDEASAAMIEQLANTFVPIVPQVTEVIGEDGSVRFERADPQPVSLLELGVSPTFYQFREATVEVTMDLEIVERLEEEGTGRNRFGLFAGTAAVQAERKLRRDITVASKLTATMVPVPAPIRLEPARRVVTEEATP